MVTQRRRNLLTPKSRLRSGTEAAIGQPEVVPAAVVVAAVWTVSCVVAAVLPGVSEAGAKVAVAPAGSPLAEKVMALEYAPFCGVTVMEY